MEWTEETIARLKALWQEGLSTAEIGRQLGITKNAVVGKAHRLGLPARPSPIRREKAKTTAKSTGEEGSEQPKKAATPRRSAKATPEASPAAPTSAPVTASEAPATAAAVLDDQKVAAVPAAKASEPEVVATKQAEPVKPKPATIVQLVPAAKEQSAPVPQERKVTSAASRAAAQRLTSIMEPRRRSASCCWPLGDPGTPGFHFCGATPLPGKPYCAEHAAMAYVKLRDRRDSA